MAIAKTFAMALATSQLNPFDQYFIGKLKIFYYSNKD
jgi:uncharacterized membrane protein